MKVMYTGENALQKKADADVARQKKSTETCFYGHGHFDSRGMIFVKPRPMSYRRLRKTAARISRKYPQHYILAAHS